MELRVVLSYTIRQDPLKEKSYLVSQGKVISSKLSEFEEEYWENQACDLKIHLRNIIFMRLNLIYYIEIDFCPSMYRDVFQNPSLRYNLKDDVHFRSF